MTATLPNSQLDSAALQKSRAFCRDITKRQARNFYYGLKLLPEPKRSAMYALYAYMRLVDDIADDDARQKTLSQRQQALDRWQHLTQLVYAVGTQNSELRTQNSVWPAFIDLIQIYKIPAKIFDDMIAGQRQDLTPSPISTFTDLHEYCYRVASVVGIASLYVWGFDAQNFPEEETLKLATDRGIAFQLTNVLRDLREDSARGRCYLPLDELAKHDLTPEQIGRGGDDLRRNAGFLAMMRFQVDRARSYYESSSPLDQRVAADSRPTLAAMTSIYRGILEKIAARPTDVLTRRVRLSAMQKLLIAWRAVRKKG